MNRYILVFAFLIIGLTMYSQLSPVCKPSDYLIGSTYPVVGLVEDQGDQVQAAIYNCGSNSVVSLENQEWIVHQDIAILDDYITIRDGRLKRADSPNTALTANALIGDTKVFADVTGLKLGMRVAIADLSAPNGGQGDGETSQELLITAIGAADFDFLPALAANFDIGDIVFSSVILLKSDAVIVGSKLDNITFDGNDKNNSVSLSWLWNGAIGSRSTSGVIQNCNFVNFPSEVVTSCHNTIRNVDISHSGGSAFHMSCAAGPTPSLTIDNVRTSHTNKTPFLLSGHNEGDITFSNLSQNLVVTNSIFHVGGEGCWGDATTPNDCPITATNLIFNGFRTIHFATPPVGCFTETNVVYLNITTP